MTLSARATERAASLPPSRAGLVAPAVEVLRLAVVELDAWCADGAAAVFVGQVDPTRLVVERIRRATELVAQRMRLVLAVSR